MLYTSRWHNHYLNILVIDLVFYLYTEYEFLSLQEGIKTVAILACLWRSSRWRWGLRGPGLWRRTAGTGALSSRLFGDIRIWAVVFFSVLVVWWWCRGARYQIWSRRKNIEKFVSPPVVLAGWLTDSLPEADGVVPLERLGVKPLTGVRPRNPSLILTPSSSVRDFNIVLNVSCGGLNRNPQNCVRSKVLESSNISTFYLRSW